MSSFEFNLLNFFYIRAKFFVKAKLGIIPVVDQIVDMCAHAADNAGSCPIEPSTSPISITFAYPIPSSTPSITVALTFTGKV